MSHRRDHRRHPPRLACALIDPLEPRRLLANTIYVDDSSPGPTRNGTSWSTAYTDLQLALAAATAGDTIKVATGIYRPTSTTNRDAYFSLKSGTSLLGGYAGFPSSTPDARDFNLHPTTLSGDIGTQGNKADNSYHVVFVGGGTAATTLDGFIIRDGNASGASEPKNSGGGLYLESAKGVISNCTLTNNSATQDGGAAYSNGSTASIINCKFTANSAQYGAAVAADGHDATTFNTCLFTANSPGSFGGTLATFSFASTKFYNCTVAGNAGLALYNAQANPVFSNCIVWNSGGVYNYYGSPFLASFTYSDVQGGYAGTGNINADPKFVAYPSDLRLQSSSPCLDKGQNSILSPSASDLAGNARLTDILTIPNPAVGWADMGCYEYPVTPPVLWLTQTTGRAFESDGTFDIPITLTSFPSSPITVPVSITGGTAGPDDVFVPATITIPAGQPNGFARVTLADDRAIETAETVEITLGTPDGGVITSPITFTLTILDNDLLFVDAKATAGSKEGSSWSDAFVDLQAALAKSSAGTTLRIAAGTYKPASSLNPLVSFVVKSGVTVTGGFAGLSNPSDPDARDIAAYPTILSGGGYSYHVVVTSGTDASTLLDGLTIRDGNAETYDDNHNFGGGLLNLLGSPTITRCTFLNNSGRRAGAIFNSGSPTITDCTFIGNTATSGDGGAIVTGTSPNPVIARCTFISNSATGFGLGGAIRNYSSNALILDCTFLGNRATYGGAIANSSPSGITCAPIIANCSFVSNLAQLAYGGAIYNAAGTTPLLVNCTLVGNRAGGYGGGICNISASPVIANCILRDNFAPSGSQIYADAGSNASVTYSNVHGDYIGLANFDDDPLFLRAPSPGADKTWGTADDDYGDVRLSPLSPCIDRGNNSAVPAAASSFDLGGRPRFLDVPGYPDTGVGGAPIIDLGACETLPSLAADAGGPYTVLPGQPLLLHGLGTSDAAGAFLYEWDWTSNANFYDAAGQTVPFPSDSFPAGTTLSLRLRVTDSVGRVIIAPPTTVRVAPAVSYVDPRATGNATGTSWTNAFTNLATALTAATAGQTIRVAAATYLPTATSDRSVSFTLMPGVAVYGGYAGLTNPTSPDSRNPALFLTTLSGDIGTSGSATDNSYHVVDAGGADASAILDGFTITGGNANVVTVTSPNSGGGLLVLGGSPTISNTRFLANRADTGGAVFIGPSVFNGVAVTGGGASFINCSFVGNSATASGGVVFSTVPSLFLNSAFVGNSAATGGGIYTSAATLLVGCPFVKNSVTQNGGALYITAGASVATGCIFWANDTAFGGSQIQYAFRSLTLTYSDLQGGTITGTGNINADPRFYRLPSKGPDNTWGTPDDDYGDLRLLPNSPAIDAGSNAALPPTTPTDLAGNPRTLDFPATGPAGSAVVDMGAYESSTNLGTLHLTAGQSITLPAGAHAFSATNLILDPGASLDLRDSTLLITPEAPDAHPGPASLRQYLFARQLISSLATPTQRLGYLPDGASTLVKLTPTGDANLDGRLTPDDAALLDRGRLTSGSLWHQGDFDYDGQVTPADAALLHTAMTPAPTPAPALAIIAPNPALEDRDVDPDHADTPAAVIPSPTKTSVARPNPKPTTTKNAKPHPQPKPKKKKAPPKQKPKHPRPATRVHLTKPAKPAPNRRP